MDPSSSPALKRNWADLQEGPAGQIADLVLAYDVAGYLRFRAVCRSWRRCTAEPRAEGGLDRRFHPRRWILLREELATPDRRRRLLNTSTGECVQVDLPELRDHKLLSVTAEGLLVLLHKRQRASATVRLLNPLTRHLTELPPLATMLPKNLHVILSYTQGWGSGILDDDDSTVVLSFNELDLLAVAKPGDASWTPVSFHSGIHTSSSMFAGRYYCVTHLGVMVLKNQPPRLEVAAELPARVSKMAPGADSVHLVDNAGELMLVHRRSSYDVYRMDLDGGTPRRVNSFGGGGGGGGHALFIGAHCSLSVPIGVFPTGSISGDTIYSGFDDTKGDYIQAYHIGDKSTTYVASGKMALPHTLLNCLSLCITACASEPLKVILSVVLCFYLLWNGQAKTTHARSCSSSAARCQRSLMITNNPIGEVFEPLRHVMNRCAGCVRLSNLVMKLRKSNKLLVIVREGPKMQTDGCGASSGFRVIQNAGFRLEVPGILSLSLSVEHDEPS